MNAQRCNPKSKADQFLTALDPSKSCTLCKMDDLKPYCLVKTVYGDRWACFRCMKGDGSGLGVIDVNVAMFCIEAKAGRYERGDR